jgi:fructose-1,6-bisphosphatase/inositol monophosphatase family enzyme/ADP-ribosylglycohydrolase
MDLSQALGVALAAARSAGDILREDFHRPGGPRGKGDKADADLEAEHEIRDRLQGAFPEWGYLGEETGRGAGKAGAPVWLVDPNDGTRDYLLGRRGSAVSIGLLAGGQPVLGVVLAFAYPGGEGDLFAWAEGCGPLRRNGRDAGAPLPSRLEASDVVLVSSKGDEDPEVNLRCSEPARFRSVPSIAHRLALVAAGEAAAATSLYAPGAWDYAAGHALVRAVGGVLLNESGSEVRYDHRGSSQSERAFAGSAPVARELARRPWVRPGKRRPRPAGLVQLRRGEAVPEVGLLARAQGCLLGQVAGDSLGGLAAAGEPAAALYSSNPPRRLEDGGRGQRLAGQPGADSELALALARSILAKGEYAAEGVLAAYADWLRSEPFDGGGATEAALAGGPSPDSQTNGSLMRESPLAVYAQALPAARAVELAQRDSGLTHPHPVCRDAVAAFVVAIHHALGAGDGPEPAHRAALSWARTAGAARPVVEALEAAPARPPVCDGEAPSSALIALGNAFYELLNAPSLEEGLVATVRRGGDTDHNAAIAGALLGAVHGREAVPAQWRQMILSCRPHPLRTSRPRPMAFWPVDVLALAERLLLAGRTP